MSCQFAYLERPEPEVVEHLPALLAQAEHALAGAGAKAIGRVIGAIATAFPAARISAGEAAMRVEIYTAALSDLPEDALQASIIEGAKVWRFFPTIAEIREHAEPFVAERRRLLAALRNLSMRAAH